MKEVELLNGVLSTTSMAGRVKLLSGMLATRERILSELSILRAQASEGDFLVFYWAGHTVLDQVSDDVYLIASNTISSAKGQTSSGDFNVSPNHLQNLSNSLSLGDDIAQFSSEQNPLLFVADGCNVGDALVGRVSRDHPYFASLTSTKADENAIDVVDDDIGISPFAHALLQGLSGEANDLDSDGFISAEEIHHYLYPRVVKATHEIRWRQHPTLAGRHVHRFILTRAFPKVRSQFILDAGLTESLAETLKAENLRITRINGHEVMNSRILHEDRTLFLSENDQSLLQQGLNALDVGKRRLVLWREKNKLKEFVHPYKKSRAIIVAIDNYDRVAGTTGLRSLEAMVMHAKKLKTVLVELGFSEEDIFTLFDKDATSGAIEALLRQFWEGGKYADTDRLFFYFGGHGIVRGGNGLLVTTDYEPKQATLTTFHLNDLTGRHAANIASAHVLIALDACYSGLALPRSLDDLSQNIDQSADFAVLSAIQADVSRRARNLLLAGTEDEKALYANGGIFTDALISGLKGHADTDKNRVIQFEELALYIRNKVAEKARQTGVSQVPTGQVLDLYGKGRFLFLLPVGLNK